MIKFFRRIRQRLLSDGKFSQYLIYALGEIVLVVLGILIALSINNWNEDKKILKLERGYLEGILDDLQTDLTNINEVVIPNFRDNHRPGHVYIDSLDRNGLSNDPDLVEAINPHGLSNSGLSFHPTVGTYNAIIAKGNSSLLGNKELFSDIQRLYEVWYKRNNEYSLRRDNLQDQIKMQYTYDLKYSSKLEIMQNKELLADLYLMMTTKRSYIGLLRDIEEEIESVMAKIVEQLESS